MRIQIEHQVADALRFRRDSRLLIVLGAPNEDDSREGISYLRWDDKHLQELYLLRGARRWCEDAGEMQSDTTPGDKQ